MEAIVSPPPRWEMIAWDGFARWEVLQYTSRKRARFYRCLARITQLILESKLKKKYNYVVKIYDRKLKKFVS